MAIVKKHDFVEIEYTGRAKADGTIFDMSEIAIGTHSRASAQSNPAISEHAQKHTPQSSTGRVFDTTEEKVAKEIGIYDKNMDYPPLIICLGENHILKALEDQIIGKETEKEYIFEISPDQGFGERDPKLVHLIPISKFRQQNIAPIPGLQLNIDGVFGVVKSVSGGRCLVDFNHPLAGKDLVYSVNIKRVVEDSKEKLYSLLNAYSNAHSHTKSAQIELKEDSVNITLKQSIPAKAQEEFKGMVTRTIPAIKNIDFTIVEEKK